MLKQIGKRSYKNGKNYIGEVEVVDTETNKHYYVVAQYGSLLYATFDSSYIDSIKNPELAKPNKIEGETYWWWNKNNTKFFDFYNGAMAEADDVKRRNTITRKYARMQKPGDELKYEIISKDTMDTFACGPLGTIYEIKVRLLDDNTEIYVSLDTSYEKIYNISKNSLIKAASSGKIEEYGEPIEEIMGTQNIKKSKYYALYYLVEQFYDGLNK